MLFSSEDVSRLNSDEAGWGVDGVDVTEEFPRGFFGDNDGVKGLIRV